MSFALHFQLPFGSGDDCRAALALTECDVVNVIPVKVTARVVYPQIVIQTAVCVDIEGSGCLTALVHTVGNEVLERALRVIRVSSLEVRIFIDVIVEVVDGKLCRPCRRGRLP